MNKNSEYCVILSGGIGSRFWPFSRKGKPKQFLDFFGCGETLLQMTYRRMKRVFDPDHIFIATYKDYSSIVKEQLPGILDSNIIMEPCRRNTATAIANVSLHIGVHDPDAVICFAPSDHLVLQEDVFADSLKNAMTYAKNHDILLTIGIAPSRADVGLGYIQLEGTNLEADPVGNFFPVKTFTEKPNEELAQAFIESGEFFWNSGMFFARVTVLVREFNEHMPELMEFLQPNKESFHPYGSPEEAAFVEEAFPYCPNLSVDYGVMEKSRNVHVLIADFGWADLGTWNSVYDVAKKDENNNVNLHPMVLENNSHGNLVMSDREKKLIITQGIEDLYVIEKENVLLLCKRGEEHKLMHLMLEAATKSEDYIN